MRPLRRRAGFTLTELLVTVLIMAILAAAGVPQYTKLMETTRAEDASALLQAIAGAHQTYYFANNRTYLTGSFPAGTCGATSTGACALVFNKYLQDRDWDKAKYTFAVCDANTAGTCLGLGAASNILAAATRKAGPGAPYSSWGYYVTQDGALNKSGAAP